MDSPRDDAQLVLCDGELRLRTAVLPDDIPLAELWYSDPEVMRFSEGDENARYDLAMIEAMYRYLQNIGELYIIELHQDGRWSPIGDVTLAPDTLPIVIGVADYRSRGYGKRALNLLVTRANALGWSEMRTKAIYADNTRSLRLFKSLGFMQDGDIFDDDEGIPSYRFIKHLR